MLSSADPEKAGTTAKGVMLMMVPIFIALLGFEHIQVSSADLTSAIDAFFQIVSAVFAIASLIHIFIGMVVKIYRSATGQNKVVA